jgi:sugar diacid utilization regulator
MTTKEDLVRTIKEWMTQDTQIKSLQQKIKEYRTKKKVLSDSLLDIMKENQIDCFDINNGKIIYCKNRVKTPLNKKTLLETLERYFENNPDINATEVSKFVLDNREVKITENIRRK